MAGDWAGTPLKPAVEVRHARVPGRTRLRLQGAPTGRRALAAATEALRRSARVQRVEINPKVMSVLVEHDRSLSAEAVAEIARTASTGPSQDGRPPERSVAQPAVHWYAQSPAAVLKAHSSRASGLSSEEAATRVAMLGQNVLPEEAARRSSEILFRQFRSLPIWLLLGSAGLSLATGGLLDAAVTIAVVVLNTGIGFTTESWTERMIRRLARTEENIVPVRRDGAIADVSSPNVTLGDILVLSAGVPVAADARLVVSDELAVDESILTGESYPACKDAHAKIPANAPLPARATMVHCGGVVVGGRGAAVVTAIGTSSEIGLVQGLLKRARAPQAPLDRELERLGARLTAACLAAGGILIVLMRARGAAWLGVMRSAVALAAAAIPEGLPAIAATSKAMVAHALARRGVLVRNLSVIETAASVDVLCLDKTGTLTQNRMAATVVQSVRARHRIDPDTHVASPPLGPDSSLLARVAILCNDAEVRLDGAASGSGTEAALLALAAAASFDLDQLRTETPRTDAWYRNKDRAYMATEHNGDDGPMLAVKGAPEQVLDLCQTALVGGHAKPLTMALRKKILAQNAALAGEGLRILGFAQRMGGTLKDGDLHGLRWLGLVGLSDPLRPGAAELINNFQRAGVRTLILTGDQAITARTLAAELGLAADGSLDVVDASILSALSPTEIARIAETAEVFARVSPADKLRIVEALQATGRVVAMSGDGVNDGPALRAADIGLAMGQSGSQVAKDVADIVIADDGLEGIARFLARGRTAEANIRRSVRFMLGTNLSETLLLVAEALRSADELEDPLEILWLNLVTDVFPALGLAVSAPGEDISSNPPRPADQPLFDRKEAQDVFSDAAAMAGPALASHLIGMTRYGAAAQTRGMTLLTLVGAQLAHALALAPRRRRNRADTFMSRWGTESGAAISGALLLAPYVLPALGRALGIARPRTSDMMLALALGIAPLFESRSPRIITPTPRDRAESGQPG